MTKCAKTDNKVCCIHIFWISSLGRQFVIVIATNREFWFVDIISSTVYCICFELSL